MKAALPSCPIRCWKKRSIHSGHSSMTRPVSPQRLRASPPLQGALLQRAQVKITRQRGVEFMD